MYVCYRIFCLLKLEGLPLYAATAVVCFHPVFILLSGSLNNDMLSILLMALTVLFAIKWYQNGRWRELILSALFAGLALMTKQSAVFVAVPVGILFLVVLIRRIREHTVGKSIKEIVTYLSISLPIGLWFPVYNWIRWDMPLFFVYPLSRELLQYLGDRSFLSRITDFSPGQFSSIYEQWLSAKGPADGSYNEFNPFTALLKNSLFGEFVKDHTFDKMPAMNVVTLILFITGTILAVSAFVLMLVNVIRDRSELWFERIALGAFFLVMLVGYYVAAWRYPFVCTMDFRYIPLTVPVGACFLALGMSRIRGNVSGRTGKTRTITYYGWLAITGLFCISSVVMYIGLLVLTSGK